MDNSFFFLITCVIFEHLCDSFLSFNGIDQGNKESSRAIKIFTILIMLLWERLTQIPINALWDYWICLLPNTFLFWNPKRPLIFRISQKHNPYWLFNFFSLKWCNRTSKKSIVILRAISLLPFEYWDIFLLMCNKNHV